jgi:hypothetical protein
MSIRTLRGIFVSAMACAALVGTISPAQAAALTQIKSCSAGGFTGYFEVYQPGGVGTSAYFYYRINKGSQSGGNNANVNVSDGRYNPIVERYSADSMIQDNAYHRMTWIPSGGGYGGMNAQFIFDLKDNPDPRCNTASVSVNG